MTPANSESDALPSLTPRRMCAVLKRVAELATVAVGIPTMAALGASYAWPFELFSHFRVQYAVTLLATAGLFVALRHWRWCVAAAALFCLNAWWIAPFLLPGMATVSHDIDAGAPTVTLASINVYSGNPTPERVMDYVRETNPDVIVLLEVTPAWEERLGDLADSHPYSAARLREDNFGISMFARFPLHDVTIVPLSETNNAISARVEIEGQSVHVVATHPYPPMGARGSELRNRQLRKLAALAQPSDIPTVVAGDLNITPFSPVFDDFLAAAKLRDPRRGHGLLPTWPSRRLPLWIPIDHCLVTEGIAARLVIGPDVGSDHRPLLATLQLKPHTESTADSEP